MTRTKYLNDKLQKLLQERGRGDESEEIFIEFRPNTGWFLCFAESRYIGDTGEYIGSDWYEAQQTMMILI